MILNLTGGSAGIELAVVGGLTQPASPAENTVWLKTETEIGEVFLQSEAPETALAGDVWIQTGVKMGTALSDVVGMKLSDSPSLVVSAVNCYLYDGAAWNYQMASIYTNGAWTTLYLLSLKDGTLGTGSWLYGRLADGLTEGELPLTNGVWASGSQYRSNVYALVKVDVTPFSRVEAIIYGSSSSSGSYLQVLPQSPAVSTSYEKRLAGTSSSEVIAMDLSDTVGEKYVGAYGGSSSSAYHTYLKELCFY